MKAKSIIQIGATFGMLAVGLGAFGAHTFKEILEETGRLDTYETAVAYHFYHSLGLLMVGILFLIKPHWKKLKYAAIAMSLGIIIFSGSLYVLSLTGLTWLGAITPFGGVAFIIGWVSLFLASSKKNQKY